jgi:hypothetical protein
MLGFVLCHKLDDNYGQHARDCLVSTGSPCETKIYNTEVQNCLIIRRNGYDHKATVLFHMCLLAYHDERDLRKTIGIGKGT